MKIMLKTFINNLENAKLQKLKKISDYRCK